MSLAFCSFLTKIAPSTSILRLPPELAFFKDVPRVLLVFVKNKQNAQDIRQKRGKGGKHRNFNGYVKTSKTLETSSKNLFFCGAPERPPRCPHNTKINKITQDGSRCPRASRGAPGRPPRAQSHPLIFSRNNKGVVRGLGRFRSK